MKTTFIYVLKCPKTEEIRYVGKSNTPKQRFNKHLTEKIHQNTYKWNWIRKLKLENLKPTLEIIDEVPISEWKYWEKFYINKYIKLGCKLTNYTEGGDGLTFGNQTSFKKGQNVSPVVALHKNGSFYKEFSSIKEATETIKVHGISSVVRHLYKTAGGYIWLYKEEYNKLSEDELNIIINNANTKEISDGSKKTMFKTGTKVKGRPILQIDRFTNEIIAEYKSVYFAKKVTGITSIYNVLNGRRELSGGYKWKWK